MIVFAGVNGAGKSHLTKILSDRLAGYQIIDADAIARNLNPSNPEKANMAAGRKALRLVDEAISARRNFTIETTLSGGNAIRQMQKAREMGYHVSLCYVGLNSPGHYIERVRQRVLQGGHFIPAETIRHRYVTSFENLPKAMRLANEVFLFDNSKFYETKVEIKENQIVRQAPDLPDWAIKALHAWDPDLQAGKDAQSRYCYPGTDVLINRLEVKDQELLSRFEDVATSVRIWELEQKGVSGKFDFQHLKDIHRHIFQDVYPFAGQIRQEDIHKGFHFARHQFIESEGKRLMGELAAENYLKGLDIDQFAKRAAHYMAELNVLHPFREGNGRTLREFMRQLSLNAGYNLDFNLVPRHVVFEASVKSVVDPEPLAKVIRGCLHETVNQPNQEWVIPRNWVKLKDVLKIADGLPAPDANINSNLLNRNVERFRIEKRRGKETVQVKLQDDFETRSIPIQKHPYLTPARKNEILEQAASAQKAVQLDQFLER